MNKLFKHFICTHNIISYNLMRAEAAGLPGASEPQAAAAAGAGRGGGLAVGTE